MVCLLIDRKQSGNLPSIDGERSHVSMGNLPYSKIRCERTGVCLALLALTQRGRLRRSRQKGRAVVLSRQGLSRAAGLSTAAKAAAAGLVTVPPVARAARLRSPAAPCGCV